MSTRHFRMSATKIVSIAPVYRGILSILPKDVSFCFAYGSGVFKQSGSAMANNMIDLIIAVDDPHSWHRENIAQNPSHYSALRILGHDAITFVQTQWSARVYFNTLVPLSSGTLVKYGVVSSSDLAADLRDWSELYLSGRLHKPVLELKSPDTKLKTSLKKNLLSAAHATLLTLPETFSELEFYHSLAGLSYSGDFRMTFGEDKNKVSNIVQPQIAEFRRLYASTVKQLSSSLEVTAGGDCSQDIGADSRLLHLTSLPGALRREVVRRWNAAPGGQRQDAEDVFRAVSQHPECGPLVSQSMQQLVWASSVRQSLKSILTAGMTKSVRYAARKVIKMMQARPKTLA